MKYINGTKVKEKVKGVGLQVSGEYLKELDELVEHIVGISIDATMDLEEKRIMPKNISFAIQRLYIELENI